MPRMRLQAIVNSSVKIMPYQYHGHRVMYDHTLFVEAAPRLGQTAPVAAGGAARGPLHHLERAGPCRRPMTRSLSAAATSASPARLILPRAARRTARTS